MLPICNTVQPELTDDVFYSADLPNIMTTWTCPYCNDRIEARAVAVSHHCPAKNRVVDWSAEGAPF